MAYIYMVFLILLRQVSEQTHIPMLFWSNNHTNKIKGHCAQANSQKAFSHDNIFHTMLGLLNIESTSYQAEMDIFNLCVS